MKYSSCLRYLCHECIEENKNVICCYLCHHYCCLYCGDNHLCYSCRDKEEEEEEEDYWIKRRIEADQDQSEEEIVINK